MCALPFACMIPARPCCMMCVPPGECRASSVPVWLRSPAYFHLGVVCICLPLRQERYPAVSRRDMGLTPCACLRSLRIQVRPLRERLHDMHTCALRPSQSHALCPTQSGFRQGAGLLQCAGKGRCNLSPFSTHACCRVTAAAGSAAGWAL